ncbi:MAG: Sodium-dependent anion transporter family, partial [uncultured Gemmatimonadetes bacterium]
GIRRERSRRHADPPRQAGPGAGPRAVRADARRSRARGAERRRVARGRHGRADGGVVGHGAHPHPRDGAAPAGALSAVGRVEHPGGRQPVRQRADLPVHGRVHDRARHAAVGASPAHRAGRAVGGGNAAGGAGGRLHAGDGVHQHVGEQHRDGRDDAAHRPLGRAAGAARGAGGVAFGSAGGADAGHRLRGEHWGVRHAHRHAAQRPAGGVRPADVRNSRRLRAVDDGGRADDAGSAALHLAAADARGVPGERAGDSRRAGADRGGDEVAGAGLGAGAGGGGGVRAGGARVDRPAAAGDGRARRRAVGCGDRHHRRAGALPVPCEPGARRVRARLAVGRPAAVGRAAAVRRRAEPGGRADAHGRGQVDRGGVVGAGLAAHAAAGAAGVRDDRLFERDRQQHGDGGRVPARGGLAGRGGGREPAAVRGAGRAGRQLRVHAARRHAAQRHRLRHGARVGAPDGARRAAAGPDGDRGDPGRGLHPPAVGVRNSAGGASAVGDPAAV